MPPLPASCCNLVQPGVSTVWTGQSVVETGRGLTVECLQAGEAFSVENTSQELNDLNDEIVSILFFKLEVNFVKLLTERGKSQDL